MILTLLCVSAVVAVGPDLTARDRLVKDLPNGVFAGKKLTPKVKKDIDIDIDDNAMVYLLFRLI